MSDTKKPRRHGRHHYTGLRVRAWYKTIANRWSRHITKSALKNLPEDELLFPKKREAFDPWDLD
jgi:hypothetical protein